MKNKKIIFHIGHKKTGTTTLQSILKTNRHFLRTYGIDFPLIYPDKGNSFLLSQHLQLNSTFTQTHEQWLKTDYKTACDMSRKGWHGISTAFAASDAHTLLISAEGAFHRMTKEAITQLTNETQKVADQTDLVAYIRSPHTYVLSFMQQQLKWPFRLSPIERDRMRNTIEPLQSHWSGGLSLNTFDKSLMKDGNVVADFMSKYLGDVPLDQLEQPMAFENKSFSAEATAILMDINTGRLRLPRNWTKFRSQLAIADAMVPHPTKPKLFPQAAQSILNWCTRDLYWLRDQYGITFPDVDYDNLQPQQYDERHLACDRIEDICPVDTARKARVYKKAQILTCTPAKLRGVLANVL